MKQELSAFELKEQGNKYFAHQKYHEAADFYTRAIVIISN